MFFETKIGIKNIEKRTKLYAKLNNLLLAVAFVMLVMGIVSAAVIWEDFLTILFFSLFVNFIIAWLVGRYLIDKKCLLLNINKGEEIYFKD